jgi:TolB protein
VTKEGPSSKDLFDAIHVVVGPSARSLDPVAIAEPSCGVSKDVCATIDETLTKDLTISGYFKVLDRQSFIANPRIETLTNTNFADWANIGAKYVVKCEVSKGAQGYDIEFRLLSVPDKKAIPCKSQSRKGVASAKVRKATHDFVNSLIEVITGKAGIFGSRIVLSVKTGQMERSIAVIDMDGSNFSIIVKNDTSNMFPKWAPGGKILYTSMLPGYPTLYLGERRITNDTREYRGAVFTPDGKHICASVNLDGQSDLVLLDPNTGEIIKNITNTPYDEVSPSFSKDGSMIAYVSNKTGHPQVYVIKSDGTGERRLTMAGAYNTSPRFGPDGRVLFIGMDDFVTDIFSIDLAGNMTRLTQDQGNNRDPAWSPDGRYIVFLSDRTGRWKVWIMTDDGRYQFPITEKAMEFATPDWGF